MFFVEHVKYGSQMSRVNIASQTRKFLSFIQSLFGSPNTPSEKLISYEAIQVANGYHEIFKEIFFPPKGKY